MNSMESDNANGRGKPARGILHGRIAGFSLIELMIVLAIIVVLVGLALPGYQAFIRKANRGEAQQLLMNWANLQEIWRSGNPAYSADNNDVPHPTHAKYEFSVVADATSYTLTADATGTQQLDKQQGVSCDVMTINQANTKQQPECW